MLTLQDKIRNCTACNLHTLMPDGCKPVPGIGPLNAKIAFIAEALGEDESILGEPLVGQCGQLFDKMLKSAGINRTDVWLDNIVHCRPINGKKNRPPSRVEINACQDWVIRTLELVKPKVIVTMGKIPTYSLLKEHLVSNFALGPLTGKIFTSSKIPGKVIPVLHPSAIMVYSRSEMQRTIDIFKMVRILSEQKEDNVI